MRDLCRNYVKASGRRKDNDLCSTKQWNIKRSERYSMDLVGKSIFILKYNSEYDLELIIVFANILSTLQYNNGICDFNF